MSFGELPSPTPDQLFDWLKVAALLGGLFLLVLKIIEHYSEKKTLPQPLEIKQVHRCATWEEHSQLKAEFHDFKAEQASHNELLRREAHEGRRKLHQDIEETPRKVIQLLRDTKDLL